MLVTHKHIAYNDSSYSSVYWQGVIIPNVPCDNLFDGAWSSVDANYYWRVILSYTDAPVGTVITINGIPHPVSGSGEIVHKVGKPTAQSRLTVHLLCDSGCSDNSDCDPCEKCVNGECVPCDKCVDGKGIVTLWGVKTSDGGILSDGLSVDISPGVASVHLSNFDASFLTAGRIQIFNGFSGTLTVKAGIGILGSDFGASVTVFSGSVSGHYQDFLFDSGNLPFGYSFNGKVTFEILNYDTLGDCADDTIDNTPDDAPIDIVDGGEPQPPGGSGPGTVTPPGGSNTIIKVIVIKPSPPDTGCECEKYLADALYYNFDSLGNRLIDLTNSLDARLSEQNSLIHSLLSDQNRILFEQLSESNRLSYELSLFLARKLYPQILSVVSSLESIRDDIKKGLIEGDDGLIDIVKTGLQEGDKGLVDFVKDFTEQYEPVTIENEYRTQSHRVIDNLDEVVNKL